MIERYELAASTWGDAEKQAAIKVIESGNTSMGENVLEFELQFSKYVGSKYAVMVNSGSSANLLAISAMLYKSSNPLSEGDEVIVPSVSWSTTYYPIHQCGLKLVFVDINLDTLNIDVDKISDAITDRTKALFVPNLLGNSAELKPLKELCIMNNLYLIEDNCESMGAEYNNKKAGSYGILGTFSTFFSHHISTMEGGVVVTDDEELYNIMLSVRSHGWTRHLPENNTIVKKTLDGFYETFRFIMPGYNIRPMEVTAAIGLEQLKKLPKFIEGRRNNATFFKENISPDNRFRLQSETGLSSWFGFSVILNDSDMDRDSLARYLQKNLIEVRPIVAGNFLKSESLKYLKYRISGDHINANIVHNKGFFVGNNHIDISKSILMFKNALDNY